MSLMGPEVGDFPVMMVSYKRVRHASCVQNWLDAQRDLIQNMHDLMGWRGFDCFEHDAFRLLLNVLETNSGLLAPVWPATFSTECNGDPLSFLVAFPPNHVLRMRFSNTQTTMCGECDKRSAKYGCPRCFGELRCPVLNLSNDGPFYRFIFMRTW